MIRISKFELSPCPFCAGKLVDIVNEEEGLSYYQVGCKQCGAVGPDKPTIWKAINAWNKRAAITTAYQGEAPASNPASEQTDETEANTYLGSNHNHTTD